MVDSVYFWMAVANNHGTASSYANTLVLENNRRSRQIEDTRVCAHDFRYAVCALSLRDAQPPFASLQPKHWGYNDHSGPEFVCAYACAS